MRKRYLLLVFFTLGLLISPGHPAEKEPSPTIHGFGSTYCYENLRGNFFDTRGYLFTVSPDERWILVSKLHTLSNFSYYVTLDLLYEPTLKMWTHRIEKNYSASGGWYPNCFSKSSDLLYYGNMVTPISPSMTELDFSKSERPIKLAEFEGSFLGFDRPKKNRKGAVVQAWWSLTQDEGEFGEIDWNYSGTVLYESLEKGRAGYLRVSPPGENRGISYQLLINQENDRMADSFRELQGVMPELLKDARNKEEAGRLRREFNKLFKINARSVTTRLSHLAVSPDEKFLAAIARLSRGSVVGPAESIYGVLIPLDRGGLAAFPFSRNVYGKILWGTNARRIYYYAQPVAGGGNGTVCRLDLDLTKFPERIATTRAPTKKAATKREE